MNVWVTYYARQERTLRAGAIGRVRTLFEPSVRHFKRHIILPIVLHISAVDISTPDVFNFSRNIYSLALLRFKVAFEHSTC